MITILIATDFSRASRNAALYGIQLAKALNAKVILFNAYQVPTPAPSLSVSISRYDIMKQTELKLKHEAEKITYINMPPIKTICDEGVAHNAIINLSNEKKADFIVAGMKGSGKNVKMMFGSTVTSLARNTNTPVIAVPENTKFKNPASVIFANDRLDIAEGVPKELIEITNLFKCKLYVVKVIKNKREERLEVSDTLHHLNKSVQIPGALFEYPVDNNITHALNEVIKKHNADMLVMTPRKHDWLERLFKKSETKNMIFHTHIPILILPEASIEKKLSNTKTRRSKCIGKSEIYFP